MADPWAAFSPRAASQPAAPAAVDPWAAFNPKGGTDTPPQDSGSGPLVVNVAPNRQQGAGQAPSGFATRAQREGTDTQAREGEYLADAVRTRLQQDQASPFGRVDAYVRGVASWVPGMDKLAAAGDAAFGAGQGETFGDRYGDNLMRQRAMDQADETLNPGSRLTGQAAGLLATAELLPALKVVREGVRGAGALNAAATGGLYGALTGAVENDGGVSDKAAAAAQGGVIGGTLGAAAPAFVRGAEMFAGATGKLAGKVAAPFRAAASPETEAARRINEALARDGVADPAARLAELQSTGANAVIGDIGGETTRRLARSASNLSSEGGEALTNAVSDRFAGQGDRITDILKGFGPSAAGKTLEQLEQAARLANRPAYGRAYMQGGGGLWNDTLESLSQAPAVQEAIRSVLKTGANKTVAEGMPPIRNAFTTDAAGNLTLARRADGSIARPNLQFWDYVSRELRGKAGEAARAGNKDLASDYGNLRRMLLSELDTAVPSFKEARSGAARFFQAEDALEAGQKFVTARMANDEARKAVMRMKPQERELFAEGFRSDLIAKIREIGDGRDIVKAVFGNPASREKIEIALGKSQAQQLHAALTVEQALLPLQTAVKGNSTTWQQVLAHSAAAATPATVGGIAGFMQGRDTVSTLAGAAAGAALKRGNTKINEALAKRIGQMLASDDLKLIQNATKAAAKSPAVMRFIQDFADEAAKLGGLSAGPSQVPFRPGGTPVNLPAAANEEQR